MNIRKIIQEEISNIEGWENEFDPTPVTLYNKLIKFDPILDVNTEKQKIEKLFNMLGSEGLFWGGNGQILSDDYLSTFVKLGYKGLLSVRIDSIGGVTYTTNEDLGHFERIYPEIAEQALDGREIFGL